MLYIYIRLSVWVDMNLNPVNPVQERAGNPQGCDVHHERVTLAQYQHLCELLNLGHDLLRGWGCRRC